MEAQSQEVKQVLEVDSGRHFTCTINAFSKGIGDLRDGAYWSAAEKLDEDLVAERPQLSLFES